MKKRSLAFRTSRLIGPLGFGALAVLLAAPANADQENCTGSNLQTGALVYGTCTDGSFSGYDSVNGASVFGTCSEGYFNGTEVPTGAAASGTCTQSQDVTKTR